MRDWILAQPLPARLREPTFARRTRRSSRATRSPSSSRGRCAPARPRRTCPDASFAGQQETFLNISGIENILAAVRNVFASLYNDRAIAYRVHHGFDHHDVALSAGVQRMVRSDVGASGVLFTVDTESGFDRAVFITSSYGLGEAVVQGAVEPGRVLRLQARPARRPPRDPEAGRGGEGGEDGLRTRAPRRRQHRASRMSPPPIAPGSASPTPKSRSSAGRR